MAGAANQQLPPDRCHQQAAAGSAEHIDAHTQLEPVDLAAAALHAVEQLAALADRRRIDLGLDLAGAPGGALVLAQPALLDALVANLLDNALRCAQEGGRVTMGVRRLPAAGRAAIELWVEHNGPGIAPEVRERVFDSIYRAALDTEGTGLDLAIVQQIARAYGASVALASNPHGVSGLLVTARFAGV